ncbi:winged helix-turn-helix transcriptional regulator [uncultured Mycobacterium sp.]|uniref:winged helix-turn-helix transcriptional regulator n=1 Tax=uncultured Mycobacterium sp. TaxID=171292 RepID=UPI0035CAF5A2
MDQLAGEDRGGGGRSSDGVSCDSQLVEVFHVLGKRWSGVIIATLLQRPVRFSELGNAIPGISDSVLNARLRELIEVGLVERQLAEGLATAVLYRLTAAGEDFRAAFDELRAWAVRNDGVPR